MCMAVTHTGGRAPPALVCHNLYWPHFQAALPHLGYHLSAECEFYGAIRAHSLKHPKVQDVLWELGIEEAGCSLPL